MRASIGSYSRWVAVLAFATVGPLYAGPVRSGFDGDTLPTNDDESSGAVSLGFTGNFFGVDYSQIFVNNNGNITFDAPLAAYTPLDLASNDRAIIAPFFADVDTTGTGTVSFGTGSVDGRAAFGVTWDAVGHYNANTDNLNTFQVVLVDRSDTGVGNFDIEFNYDVIQWETGDFSGGVNGVGGASARVGFSDGSDDPGASFELDGSAVNGAFLDGGPSGTALTGNSLNSTEPGRYVFYARDGGVSIVPPMVVDPVEPGPVDPSPSVPEPATLLMVLGGIAASGLYWRRRRKAIA